VSEGREVSNIRRALLLLSTMALVVLLAAGVALAEMRIGTDASETIVGTNSGDLINGKGGNDTLKGLAANDVYHFDDGLGHDTLIESAFVKVGKKKKPGGIDTLNFSQVSDQVNVKMVPQWGAQDYIYNRVSVGPFGQSVDLGTSPVENAVGGSNHDLIIGGSAKNIYKGGPGGNDVLADVGGDDGSAVFHPELPDLPASDDTYMGFTSGTGHDLVVDYGGTRDVLDLRPLQSTDVYVDSFDYKADGTNDALKIVIYDTTSVTVIGHFAPQPGDTDEGRMEQIIFSDQVFTSAAELNSLM
jgi:hypothetical protein